MRIKKHPPARSVEYDVRITASRQHQHSAAATDCADETVAAAPSQPSLRAHYRRILIGPMVSCSPALLGARCPRDPLMFQGPPGVPGSCCPRKLAVPLAGISRGRYDSCFEYKQSTTAAHRSRLVIDPL